MYYATLIVSSRLSPPPVFQYNIARFKKPEVAIANIYLDEALGMNSILVHSYLELAEFAKHNEPCD